MFEEYLQDAYSFFELGKSEQDIKRSKRYFRCAVFCGASAMEAFINYMGDTFTNAGTLSRFECAFVNDKEIVFDPRKGKEIEKIRYFSVEDKTKFIIKKFVPDFNFENDCYWTYFIEFKALRDQLVHPRITDDEIEFYKYQQLIGNGITGNIILINKIVLGVFNKPLRRKILDLIPE